MAKKLVENTYGSHIYMKMKLDSGRIEEIDVYFRDDGTHYRTSADACPENHPAGLRDEIISTFGKLHRNNKQARAGKSENMKRKS